MRREKKQVDLLLEGENSLEVKPKRQLARGGKVRIIDGFSESLWKSMVVKALRMGWVNGLKAANARLCKSTMKSLLTCGVFEDVFPARDDFKTVMKAVQELDFKTLCVFETHHGREGYTQEFFDMREEAKAAKGDIGRKRVMWESARELGFWVPPRTLNCFWTWLRMAPGKGGVRKIDRTGFVGIPKAMMDGHTYEGKVAGSLTTILSGSYEQHLELSKLVQYEGWEYVREKVHSEGVCNTGLLGEPVRYVRGA